MNLNSALLSPKSVGRSLELESPTSGRGGRQNAYVELLTGLGLATAAGLNAYIPLLALGLLSRFTDLVTLPHGWAWLENGWVMTIVAVLLVVEIVADKIPALDTINDTIQTFVRPTAGGIVFGSGTAAQTAAVTDPGAFAQSGQWIPVVDRRRRRAGGVADEDRRCGPAANVATAGVAAPVLSTIEDVASVGLVFVAILIPVAGAGCARVTGRRWRLWRRSAPTDAPYDGTQRGARPTGASRSSRV